jgi:H+-transporting ATPase
MTSEPSKGELETVVVQSPIIPKLSENGLTDAQVEESRRQDGENKVTANSVPEWKKILKRYTDWIVLLMLAAAIVSIAVPNYGDRGYASFGLLIFELNLVVWVGWYSDRNAGNAVKELEELSAPTALAKRNGEWVTLQVSELVVADLIQLKAGDVIPADAKLVGKAEDVKVDEAALTGESMAVSKQAGDKILSGAVVQQGEAEAVVVAVGPNTFFGKTITLLSREEGKGHLQQVLGAVQIAVGVIAFLSVVAILAVLLARGEEAGYSVVIAMVILVSTVPVGMPVVTTTVLAVGAREMAKEKAIVNRLSALEELSGVEILASDKTGTLTLNRLTLDQGDIEAGKGFGQADVLLMAALSARWENNDAIDRAITEAVGDRSKLSGYEIQKTTPFNPVDKRTTAWVASDKHGEFVATKGAPQIIGNLLTDADAKQSVTRYIASRASKGLRSLGVAKSSDGGSTWQLVGLISLLDPPREDSAATIHQAQDLGVVVKMVTGDQLAIGIETAKRLGMGTEFIEGSELMRDDLSDAELGQKILQVSGFAGVYPEHKHRIVQALQARGMLVGMTGDGVNDAPALKAANVGIAVAGATPAAQGAADIILTEDGISTIITAITRSRKIFRRLECYIIYRIASSLILTVFFFFAIICLGLELPTWVLVVISICNDLSAMATSLDSVHTSDLPLKFNMTKCMAIASAMTVISTLGCLLLLAFASINEYLDWWDAWNIQLSPDRDSGPLVTDGQVIACIYMGLTIVIQLNIISTRNPSFWWHFSSKTAPPPALMLVIPVTLFLLGATFIAVYWPAHVKPDGGLGFMQGPGWKVILVVWFYSLLWWTASDAVKALIQRVFHAHDVITERAKVTLEKMPWWVKVLDAPGYYGDMVQKKIAGAVRACTGRQDQVLPPQIGGVTGEKPESAASERARSLAKDSIDSFRSGYRGRSTSDLRA